MRVALLTNILTPYRLPVFRDLAATPGWQLRLLLSAKSEFHWTEAYTDAYEQGRQELDTEVVSGFSLRRSVGIHRASGTSQRVATHIPLAAFAALRRFAPDVIVSSELGVRTAIAAAYAAIFRVPLVVWSYQSRSAATAAGSLQQAFRRMLLTRADAAVGMGRQAREVLVRLGVPDAKVFDAPNAHDATTFERALGDVDLLTADLALRAQLHAREKVALVVGRLVESKGIEPLLEAWKRIPDTARANWTLAFVGDGPLAARIRRATARSPGEIAHLEAIAPGRMPELYGAADLTIFPSLGDPWGLVVNESMACGVPVVCSRLAGCADDLIEPGENGWLFDPTRADRAASVLEHALRSDDLGMLGARARDVAKRFDRERMAAGLRAAVAYAVGQRATDA